MKITKLIKEYVAEQVAAKYPETELEKQYTKEIKNITNKTEELNKKIKDYALDLCKQANKDLGIDDWAASDQLHISPYGGTSISYGYNNIYDIKRRALCNDRKEKINEAVKNILVNLELGATKAELDEMLKKLGEEG